VEPGAVGEVDIRGKGLFSGEEKIIIFFKNNNNKMPFLAKLAIIL